MDETLDGTITHRTKNRANLRTIQSRTGKSILTSNNWNTSVSLKWPGNNRRKPSPNSSLDSRLQPDTPTISETIKNSFEQKIPQYYHKQLYYGGAAIPTTYDNYKSRLLTIYVADERFNTVKQTTSSVLHSTLQSAKSSKSSTSSSSTKDPSSSTIPNKPRRFFRNKRPSSKDVVQQQAPQKQIEPKKKPTGNCYRCGKPGHWTRDCPELKGKIPQIRSLLQHIDDENAATDEQDFQEDL